MFALMDFVKHQQPDFRHKSPGAPGFSTLK